jgi:hypothetical protein
MTMKAGHELFLIASTFQSVSYSSAPPLLVSEDETDDVMLQVSSKMYPSRSPTSSETTPSDSVE